MIAKARARYSGGALHPLEPLGLAEGQETIVSVETNPSPYSDEEATTSPEFAADNQELSEASQELRDVASDAEEDGLEVPSEVAFANAERLLKEMYRISPRRFVVYPVSGGRIAIDARGRNDRIAVLTCDSDGGALCLVTIDGESRRARYSTARRLPDGFIREALTALDANPAP